MSIIIGNVGRRSDRWGEKGDPTDVGEFTLNGFEKNLLFWNQGGGVYHDVAFLSGSNCVEDSRSLAIADFDRDGRLDFLVNHRNRPAALLMASGGSGHWLQLELVGTKSNRDAAGARVFIEAGGKQQSSQVALGRGYLSCSSLVQHFGLGAVTIVDRIEIR